MSETEIKPDTNIRVTMDISSNFPDFEVRSIEKLGEGRMSQVFLVNRE